MDNINLESKFESNNLEYEMTIPTQKIPRRRRGVQISNDPLGILFLQNTTSEKSSELTVTEQGHKSKLDDFLGSEKTDLPSWLENNNSNSGENINIKSQSQKTDIDSKDNITNHEEQKLNEEERQLSVLLKQQIEKQTILETQINMVQTCINRLMNTTLTSANSPSKNRNLDNNSAPVNTLIEPKIVSDKWHLEIKDMETVFESLKEKYEKEIRINEESNQRQLKVVEDSFKKIQSQMEQEREHLIENYEMKIRKLQEDKQQTEKLHKEEIQSLKEGHTKFINEMTERQNHNIKLLQNEYANTIAHVSNAKNLEYEAITSVTNHKTDLENMMKILASATGEINSINEKMNERENNLIKMNKEFLQTCENSIKYRNTDIVNQCGYLKKERENITNIVEILEKYITRIESDEKQRRLLEQDLKENQIKKEQQLIWEKKHFEERMEWEHYYLQSLKESWMKEQERQLQNLLEDKRVIASNKAKANILSTLGTENEELVKIEFETMINTAREAITNANAEKQKWKEKINQLQMRESILRQKEEKLVKRAEELEKLTRIALAKKEDGIKALLEARQLEEKQKDRQKRFLTQIKQLEHKESISKAKEHLGNITSYQINNFEQDYTMCHTPVCTNNNVHVTKIQPFTQHVHFQDIVDPTLISLQLDLNNDLNMTKKLSSI